MEQHYEMDGSMKLTRSICPECKKVISALIFEENGEMIIEKECLDHGKFRDVYWSDSKLYLKFENYSYTGIGVTDYKSPSSLNCPLDCGICHVHETGTLLANIDITNRCNLACPICFANARKKGFVYEPSFEEIRKMMEALRDQKPVPCSAIQFSGGEPTIRDDLPKIIELAEELGFAHIQIASNGIRLAKSIEYCKRLKNATLRTIYLSFDGITPEPYVENEGFNSLPLKKKAIENCRDFGPESIVLVPTLSKGVNDSQVGGIIRFAAENLDIIKGVNFQPIAFTGRVDQSQREKKRITIPDVIKLAEEQTNGEIPCDAWYPISFVVPISRFLTIMRKIPIPEFTVHPHCGAATYVFFEDGHFIPITNFLDVEGFLEFLKELAPDINGKMSRILALSKVIRQISRYIDEEKAPKSVNVVRMILEVLKEGNMENISSFHRNTLFIGTMHFQDLYNIDLDKVKKCGVHYAIPDGRIIPFCTYNLFHRDSVESKFSAPFVFEPKSEKESLSDN
jgi:7,8-dihydro-6-hydroxymethylpterin dimethyltransferase